MESTIHELKVHALEAFSQFLQRNTISPAKNLPLIHSTPAHHLKKIKASGQLHARQCDVFTQDELLYFFVGRPAYKVPLDAGESEYWELPICFVFEFTSIIPFHRIFPFDSGAFAKQRYPNYITAIGLDEFNLGNDPSIPGKVIGAFFGTSNDYFRLQAKDKGPFKTEFNLDVFDHEVLAMHKLATDSKRAAIDDRRMTVEVQINRDIDLAVSRPLAVICPHVYLDNNDFLDHVQGSWNAQPISYSINALSSINYYGQIYEKLERFYIDKGYLNK